MYGIPLKSMTLIIGRPINEGLPITPFHIVLVLERVLRSYVSCEPRRRVVKDGLTIRRLNTLDTMSTPRVVCTEDKITSTDTSPFPTETQGEGLETLDRSPSTRKSEPMEPLIILL